MDLNHRFRIIALTSIIIVLLLLHFGSIMLQPCPIEFREGHTMSSTTLLLQGIKPYTLDTYPKYYNSYGIVFNLVALPFVWLFGNSMQIYRILNELFVLAALAMVLFYKRKDHFWIIEGTLAVTFLLFWHINTNISVRPDGLGVLFFISAVIVATRNDFSSKSLFVAGVLSVLAFFTKPYYLLGWYLVSAGLLFYDWRKCLTANVVFHIVFVLTLILVNIIFPLYFYETIFAYGGSAGESAGDLSYSYRQMVYSLKRFLPITIGALISAYYICYDKFKHKQTDKEYVYLPMIISLSVLLFYPLGTNTGAYLTYHSQLLMPLLLTFILDSQSLHKISNVYVQVLLILSFAFSTYKLLPLMEKADLKQWQKVERYISNAERIYHDEPVAPYLLVQGKDVINDGVAGFIYSFQPQELTQQLFGKDSLIQCRIDDYKQTISSNMHNGYYDLILLSHRLNENIPYNRVDTTVYRLVEDIECQLPCNFDINVSIFLPKNESY